ncbi:MAG: class I SAM-dependent methyltransferase, partial [Planctomycetes bacterium]|nr:class I SAM-dependent methyltransferase [Planctomycetota bacterium]
MTAFDPDYAIDSSKVDNYRSTRGAEAYRQDHEQKLHRRWSTRRELAIYERMLRDFPKLDSAIDIPSGFGRLQPLLRQFVGTRLIEADFSQEMLDLVDTSSEKPAIETLQCSALDIPLADREVDLAFSIRLNHHLESVDARENHLREIFRIANVAAIVTWFSANSLKHRLREVRRMWSSKRSKNVLHDREV